MTAQVTEETKREEILQQRQNRVERDVVCNDLDFVCGAVVYEKE